MKILIIDADHDWVEMLTSWLKKLGYEAFYESTGELAKIEWEKQQPDLVILDTNLKDVNALNLCREMRSKHDVLVLVTSNEQDLLREMCLECGADDYLQKPYFPAQLLAYINTSMARRGHPNLLEIPSLIITVGPIRVDARLGEVSVDGRTARLTAMERVVLLFLAVNANTVCTISQIVSYAWRVNSDEMSSMAHVYIRKLRHKIEPVPMNPTYILTVPGVGYTLVSHDLDETIQKISTDNYV